MSDTQPERSFGDRVRELKAILARVVPGLTADDVRALLGEPSSIHARGEHPTPSDHLEALGSMFQLEDATSDVVWVFRDPLRPTFRHCVGFRDGVVCSRWHEVHAR